MSNEIGRMIVYVNDKGTAPETVAKAGRLAQRFDVSLTGLHVMSDADITAVAASGSVSPGLIDDLEQRAREGAATAKESFDRVRDRDGWTGEWLCVEARAISFRDSVAQAIHLSDLAVVGRDDPEEDTPTDASIIEDIIVDGGRPVILLPHDWTGGIGEEHIVIAWKNNREAARAVRDALPLLAKARTVTVTAAISDDTDAEEIEPGALLCDYLAAHDIEAKSHPLYGVNDSDTGEALMKHAETLGADLIVLGAFSHSRLREGLFGGVTRDVIDETRIPALLSH